MEISIKDVLMMIIKASRPNPQKVNPYDSKAYKRTIRKKINYKNQ
jgi:hypothetical protein